jgi:sec-independent protein translocase protein TatA
MGLRMPELLMILVVVLILFGAKKLPALGAGLGNGIRSFKRALSDADEAKSSETRQETA